MECNIDLCYLKKECLVEGAISDDLFARENPTIILSFYTITFCGCIIHLHRLMPYNSSGDISSTLSCLQYFINLLALENRTPLAQLFDPFSFIIHIVSIHSFANNLHYLSFFLILHALTTSLLNQYSLNLRCSNFLLIQAFINQSIFQSSISLEMALITTDLKLFPHNLSPY